MGIQKKKARAEQTAKRSLLDHERDLWSRGERYVAGVDEAGRGPLAGPVVAAAVVFPPGCEVEGVYDSKALSPEQRAVAFERIWAEALSVGVGLATPEEIDEINILQATHLAAERALAQLAPAPSALLTDFLKIPERGRFSVLPLVKGDQRSQSIAAASIVAKVVRDRLMWFYESEYPGYGLAGHKGYPTPGHLSAIRERGPSSIHRRSFSGVPVFAPSVVQSIFYRSILERIRNGIEFDEMAGMADLIEERRAWLPHSELDDLMERWRAWAKTGFALVR